MSTNPLISFIRIPEDSFFFFYLLMASNGKQIHERSPYKSTELSILSENFESRDDRSGSYDYNLIT